MGSLMIQEEHAQQAELGNLERNNQALQRDVARFEEREKLNEEVLSPPPPALSFTRAGTSHGTRDTAPSVLSNS